jgi:hypothetical protein
MTDRAESITEVLLDDPEIHPAESILSSNYKIFAVIGIFGALSVYLFEFRKSAPNEYVDWGVAGALLLFVLTSIALIHKLSNQALGMEGITWTTRSFISAIIFGLVAILLGILGIVIQFLGEVIMVGSFAFLGAVYITYINMFPWGSFNDIEGISETTAKKIKKSPDIANTWAVVAIILSGLVIPELPRIDGYNPLALIPALVIGILTHYLVSFGLRRRHLKKDESYQI